MDQTRVLVTGGCGFLGTAIVSALLRTKRYAITVIDVNPPSLGSTTFTSSVRYVRCDVLDVSSLSSVFSEARPAVVIHTVGVFPLGAKRYSTRGKSGIFKINVEGTRNVVEVSRGCGVKAFVYTSSSTVVLDRLDADFRNVDERWPVGGVHTCYGQSKAIAESLVLAANTPTFTTCALRPTPTIGPNDTTTLIPTLHALIALHATPFTLGTATNLQDYVYISNVADAHVLAVSNLLTSQTAAGQAMFITNGEPVTMRALCLAVWKEFSHVPRYSVGVPEGLMWWVGYCAEWVGWMAGTDGVLSRGVVSDGCRDRYVSIAKARALLGYEPRVGLDEGIRISCLHYRAKLEARKKT